MTSSLAECRSAPLANAYSGFMGNTVVNSRAILTRLLTCANPAQRVTEFVRLVREIPPDPIRQKLLQAPKLTVMEAAFFDPPACSGDTPLLSPNDRMRADAHCTSS
jgi:hypothetical protein